MAKYTTLKDLFAAIADAIRSKDGSEAAIVADDFPKRISSIETTEGEDMFVTRRIGSTYTNDRVTSVGYFAFYSTSTREFSFANVDSFGRLSFADAEGLLRISAPNLVYVGESAFAAALGYGGENFTIESRKIAQIDYAAFENARIEKLYMSSYTKTDGFAYFSIGSKAFAYSKIKHLVIASVNNEICELFNSNAFIDTSIAEGTGYIYVPRELVDSYKAAENWSTYASQFRALEDYTVDGTATGALDESKI